MKKLYLAALLAAGGTCFAQQQYPDPTKNGSLACDDGDWVMVLEDEFNGSVLQPHWITFVSWCGMSGGDHDDWKDARVGIPAGGTETSPRYLILDKNVVVENGVAKLRSYKENVAWRCGSCTHEHFASIAST